MASIRQLRGKWQAIVRRKGYPSTSKTFNFKQDAQKWARQQERLLDTGLWADPSAVRTTTLIDLVNRYSVEISPFKRSQKSEAYRLRKIKVLPFAKLSLASITPQQLASWRNERLAIVSSGTVLREMQLLSHVFTIAIREWGIPLPQNPVSFVRKPPQGKARDRVLNDCERSALLNSCSQCSNPWIRPVVTFALETACRRGEILSLRWDDVDLKSATAVVNGKTGLRKIPLSDRCCELLRAIPRNLDGGYSQYLSKLLNKHMNVPSFGQELITLRSTIFDTMPLQDLQV